MTISATSTWRKAWLYMKNCLYRTVGVSRSYQNMSTLLPNVKVRDKVHDQHTESYAFSVEVDE